VKQKSWPPTVGVSWSKECEEADGSLCYQQKDKVVPFCRKLREAVVTTRLNMKLLEEKLVDKFEQTYGKTADIKVNQQESTIPHCPSPLPTEEQSDNSSSNEAEAQPNKTTENGTEISKFLSTIPVDEVFFQVMCSDSDLKLPMETDESREESVISLSTYEEGAVKGSNLKTDKLLRMSIGYPDAESDLKKSQEGKEAKEEIKKTKKRYIQSDSDFQSSKSEKEKKKPKRLSPSDENSDDDKDEKSKSYRRIKGAATTSDSENSNDSY
jgi:hypothetical protein